MGLRIGEQTAWTIIDCAPCLLASMTWVTYELWTSPERNVTVVVAGPRCPSHLHDHLEDLGETLVEGCPVLEVDGLPSLSATYETVRAVDENALGREHLVDRLEVAGRAEA